jgi:hypothetical protein
LVTFDHPSGTVIEAKEKVDDSLTGVDDLLNGND